MKTKFILVNAVLSIMLLLDFAIYDDSTFFILDYSGDSPYIGHIDLMYSL